MGIHVPQKHLDVISKMTATFDLTKLTTRQLKNVKKYYQMQDFSGETVTKYIARDIWNDKGVNDHPHMQEHWHGTEVYNFPCNHKIWKDIRQYLVMCKLADTSVYEIDIDKVNEDLAEVDKIIASGSDEPVEQRFATHKVRWEWKKDNGYVDSPKDCVLKKLLNGIRKTMVPMSSDNPGIILIDSMIDGKTIEYQQTYVGEHND
jgi:hypothetical protein